jgi:malonyl-CoA O-methyltransferase
MQERLDFVTLDPKRVLDLGCSRGGSFPGLATRYPDAQLIGLDVAPAMLATGRMPRPGWQRWLGIGKPSEPFRIAADASNLPLKSRSTALVWSICSCTGWMIRSLPWQKHIASWTLAAC